MYYSGGGVPQDYVQAHMWWNLAAVNGYKDAVDFREHTTKKMTPADISNAQHMAREWLEAHPK